MDFAKLIPDGETRLAVNAFLRKTLGYELRRPRRPADILFSRKIDVVLDVGANIGQYARSIRRDGYANKIISFEPVKACYDVLRTRAEKDPLWEAHNMAVGNDDSTAHINVSASSVFSSLSTPLPAVTAFDERAKVVKTEEVPICKIDTIYRFSDLRLYLKIDTQGFEREVLMGATETLPKISAVQVEVGTTQLYDNQPSYLEICALMHDQQFSVALVLSSEHYQGERLLDVDIVFINNQFNSKS